MEVRYRLDHDIHEYSPFIVSRTISYYNRTVIACLANGYKMLEDGAAETLSIWPKMLEFYLSEKNLLCHGSVEELFFGTFFSSKISAISYWAARLRRGSIGRFSSHDT